MKARSASASCAQTVGGSGFSSGGNRVRSRFGVSVFGWLGEGGAHSERVVGVSSPEPEGFWDV